MVPRALLLALLFAAVPGRAAGLPDTGQDTCYYNTVADSVLASSLDSIARDASTHPRQDCRYGRDAAAIAGMLTKTGGGAKGFDYTKIANNGTALAASAALGTASTAWACTRDNITGLMWEVKTTFPGNLCNTEVFVAAVNAAQLCNATDWRLPSQRELLTLVNAGGSNPSIDPTYFPPTPAAEIWSGSSFAPNPANAWYVLFSNGDTAVRSKSFTHYVRLVRGGPF